VDEPPREMFGKVMSIPDALIHRYFLLATDAGTEELDAIRMRLAAKGTNPRDVKAELARRIVSMYHSAEAGDEASAEFDRMFRDGRPPDDMPTFVLSGGADGIGVVDALAACGLVKSKSDARRLIQANAVRVDAVRVEDEFGVLPPRPAAYEIRVGKRAWARAQVEKE
jgi:tyrosyl-tRNA synthetase